LYCLVDWELSMNFLKCIHDKKIVLYNFQGFYDPLVAMIQKMEEEDFLYERSRYRLQICATLEEIKAVFS